jgi:hypothetical protein
MSESANYVESHSLPLELNEAVSGFASPDVHDPVIEAFKKDVDRTLLRENLKLTMQQRSEKFLSFAKFVYEIRGKANPDLKVWR